MIGSESVGWLVAFIFGIAFNWHLGVLGRQTSSKGLNGIFVVAGVGITLLIAACVPDGSAHKWLFVWQDTSIQLSNHQHAVVYLLPFFACSGLPMLLGSLWRHWQTMD